MIDLSNDWLLMIEPDKEGKPSTQPLIDDLSRKIDFIISKVRKSYDQNNDQEWGHHCWMGWHTTKCGKRSECMDWRIPTTPATWTNSLADYYVKHYRPYIPQSEIDKIERIYNELRGVK